MAMPRKLARTLVLTVTLATLGILANAPSALAYGNTAQWQVGFSGTCSTSAAFCPFLPPGVTGVRNGFWGWCEFGGSDGSSTVGTTGTQADCQVTTYFGATTGQPTNPFHIAYDIKGWVIQANSPFVIPPGDNDFLLTSGTVTLSGPGVPPGIPVHVPIGFPFPDGSCPPMICDTGIPAVPGHFSLHPTPGAEFNVQVTKLP
jgi:hypothetical protein